MTSLLIAWLLVGSSISSDVDRIRAVAGAENRADDHARYLAGEIGPRLTATPNLARAEKWARYKFREFGLDARLEKWGEYQRPRKRAIDVHNVVAEIQGSEKPDEYVIVGAHLDSHDHAHGATDNAAGCGAVLEAARLIKVAGVTPKRTIRFALFTGEEQGLLGSRAYVETHKSELDRISAVLVMDAGTNPIRGITVAADMRGAFDSALTPLRSLNGPSFELRSTPQLVAPEDCCSPSAAPSNAVCTGNSASCSVPDAKGVSACASDEGSFLRAGVPAFLWQQTGSADYAKTHHTEHDTVDALLPDAIEHSALVIALAAVGIANLPERLPRGSLVAATPTSCTPACSPGDHSTSP